MEFEKLTRRELQTLCKKNKIPANITNVAMTQALKSLSFVEGIEEIMKPSQSETAQSSIESPERREVTSPRIPPTGGRTTRRRTAMKDKDDPETLQPMTRTTRRSTRKTVTVDDTQTPSVVQTTTKRVRVNSVCRKMDSQLKECEDEEEKRDSLVTPAPSGVSTRRKRGMKEESVVKREYSTRRSVRLAAKKLDVQDLTVDALTKEGENLNFNIKESLDSMEETSRITGNNANATVEKIFEQTKELEVVSAQMNYMQIGEGDDNAATLDTLDGIGESDDVQGDENAHTGEETEHEAAFEEEMVHKSKVDNQKLEERIIVGNTALDENLDKNYEEEEELEIVSAQEHGIQIDEEGDSALAVHNLEGQVELEDVQPKENSHTDPEIQQEVDYQKLGVRSIYEYTSVDENMEENSEGVLEVSTQQHYELIGEGITGNYANATVENNSGKKEEFEVVATDKHSIQVGEEGNRAVTLDNLEGKGEIEDVQLEENAHTDKEVEKEASFDEETVQKPDVDQKLDVEFVSAQKHYMQIGEEGDDNPAVANLDGKGESEEPITAEKDTHIGEENEQVAPFWEGTEKKSEVGEHKLDEESIHGNAREDENLEEIFEEEVELEIIAAQMQIGEEGDDHAATVDTLEGKGEGHAHSSIEIEQEATFDIKMGQKSEVDDQKLDCEIIEESTDVDRNSEENVEIEFDSVKGLKTTIEEEDGGHFDTDGLNVESERLCFVFETDVEIYEDNGENMVHDNNEEDVDSVKGLNSTVEEETEANTEANGLKSEDVKNMENGKAGIHFEPLVKGDEDVERALYVCNYETDGLKSEEVKNMENEKAGIHLEPLIKGDEDDERALDVFNYETETSAQVIEQPDTAEEVDIVEKSSATVDNSEHETEDKSAVDLSVDIDICNKMEKEISEDKDTEFKQLPALNRNEGVQDIDATIAANTHGDLVETELNHAKFPKPMIVDDKVTKSNEDVPLEISFAGSDSDHIVKPTCLTPYKVSATKASPMMKRVTIMSDNKENIDSGSKISLPKERVHVPSTTKNSDENDKNLEDLSVRKLGKMLKMKLHITNNFSKNENEVRSGRLALKSLPETNNS